MILKMKDIFLPLTLFCK
uniref:Uncharacterized protein n=1 Tax=Anguilla anguilla TaxID=7936 RepID=A0A0E9XBV5_ANGAN